MSTAFTLADLAALDPPEIIETLDYEAIVDGVKARFIAEAAARGVAYSVEMLDSDPMMIAFQAIAFQELRLRARGNDIARAPFLFFSAAAETDHHGHFYDCPRLAGESDAAYKGRIVAAIQGRSTGGTAPRYRAVALSTSPEVRDAVVYTEGTDPTVHVAVFSTEPTGVASADLLARVRARVTAPDVRMVNDRIVVRSAVVVVVPVVARVWLQPTAAETMLDTLRAGLGAAWAAEGELGRDLTRSWLVAALHRPGIQRVEIVAPAADVTVQQHQAVRIGVVTLDIVGRSW